MKTLNEFLQETFRKLPTYYIEIGVFEGHFNRKKSKEIRGDDKDITNAKLMFIHENGSPSTDHEMGIKEYDGSAISIYENGSPLRNIPARPVLHMTIEHAQKELVQPALKRAIQAYLTTNDIVDYERELDKLCVRIQKYARKIIYSNDGRLAPNSPAVAARKKGNHPLFDTGQLARSITCRLVKGNLTNG